MLKMQKPISEEFRKEIFNDLTSPTGAGMMLVSHYYFTGRPMDSTEPILTDPVEQLHWTRNHLAYFSSVSKRISIIRNALVHNGVIIEIHIQKLLDSLKMLQTKSQGNFLIDYLVKLLARDHERCEMCGSVIDAPRLAPHTETQAVTSLLLDIKRNSILKEAIKGKTVKVLSGKYYGKEGIFRSWSGTVCYIDFPVIGKKNISVEATISYVN